METEQKNELEVRGLGTADAPPEQVASARPQRRWWLVGLIAIFVLVLDQLTKYLVMQSLPMGRWWSPFPDRPDLFTIVPTMNTGTACGYFPQTNTLFSFAPLLIVAIVLYFYFSQVRPGWLLSIGTGLIIGGAFGNLIDRLRLGFVMDFVQISRWPVFNVSDAAVTTAVVVLLLWSLREESSQTEKQGQAGGTAGKGLSWKLTVAFLTLLGVLAVLGVVVCVWLPQILYR